MFSDIAYILKRADQACQLDKMDVRNISASISNAFAMRVVDFNTQHDIDAAVGMLVKYATSRCHGDPLRMSMPPDKTMQEDAHKAMTSLSAIYSVAQPNALARNLGFA